MKIIYFNLEIFNRTEEFVYDPYSNLVYHKKFERHFELLRNKEHPFQTTLFKKYPVKEEDVLPFISRNTNRLVLDCTGRCNLRCKYCVYSGIYRNRRDYSLDKMSPEVLSDTIKFFKNLKKDKFEKDFIGISFYGGEPTTNMDIVHKGINLAFEEFKEKGKSFLVTTNGTFKLDEKAINLIAENDVGIHISLDGPKEQHDKFRVYPNGEGSFDDVMRFVSRLKNRKLKFQATLHPEHDWNAINEFFTNLLKENPNFQLTLIYFTLASYKGDDYIRLLKLMNLRQRELQKKIIEKLENNQSLSVFEEAYIESHARNFDFKFKSYWSKELFMNTCFPGALKLTVNPIGEIAICERVENEYKIGDIYKGISAKRVIDLWNMLKDITSSLECNDCPFHNFCLQCFAVLEKVDNKYTLNCSQLKKEGMLHMIKFISTVNLLKEYNKHHEKFKIE